MSQLPPKYIKAESKCICHAGLWNSGRFNVGFRGFHDLFSRKKHYENIFFEFICDCISFTSVYNGLLRPVLEQIMLPSVVLLKCKMYNGFCELIQIWLNVRFVDNIIVHSTRKLKYHE